MLSALAQGFRIRILLVAMLVSSAGLLSVRAESDGGWPRQIEAGVAKVLIYQPQLESFEGNELTWRAAVSVAIDGEEPGFGAVWATSRVETDRDTRMVSILEIRIDRVRFGEASPEHQQQLADLLEREIPSWDVELSLDRLLAGLDAIEGAAAGATDLATRPPKILFEQEPAVLILLDGKPKLQSVENSDYMVVANTAFLIAFHSPTKTYYLDGGEIWYQAEDVMGPWQLIENPPADVVALRPPPPPEEEPAAEETASDRAAEDEPERDERIPRVIVVTEPTELIVADGEPAWTPLEESDLLYMSNSESNVLLEVATQRYFAALSGRWYASKSLEGPWDFVSSDELPEAFTEIQPDSEMAHLRTYVSGTEEARDAVLDNMIPQTAAVNRKDAKLDVTYDGDPQFEPIDTTEMKYAVNTQTPVILADGKYYACDEAIWFVASKPSGPWQVTDTVPAAIYTIPPSSPVYNVRYVYVYDSTPEVVYVGYTPGYTGSYVYNSTIVYGTGYYYPGWYGAYYYPRPATWGFSVRWNPWYGWSFGLSYSRGPFTISIGRGGYHGGWWGPRGYRGYRRGYNRGYGHGYRAGYRAGHNQAQRNNMYRSQSNRDRVAHTGGAGGNRNRPATADNRQNNVYADRNGDVYRKNDDGWQKREKDSWSNADLPSDRGGSGSRPSTGTTQPSQRPDSASKPSGSQNRQKQPSTGSSSSSNLSRDYNSRQRGTQRTNNYRSSGGGSRGGSRGGGGRRR